MAKLLVLYKTPTDPAAFDAYYHETHIAKAKQIPGLRHYEITRGPVNSPGGPSNVHLAAILTFDDVEAIQAAFGSPEGQKAASDLANFATGGAELFICDTVSV